MNNKTCEDLRLEYVKASNVATPEDIKNYYEDIDDSNFYYIARTNFFEALRLENINRLIGR